MLLSPRVSKSKAPAVPVPDADRVLVPSPIGALGVAYRDRTIVGLDIVPKGGRRRLYRPLKDLGPSEFGDEMLGRLSEYFAGARRTFGFDLSLNDYDFDEFTVKVFVETLQIPYGETRSYQKLASAIGAHGSYRKVRSALIANPIPILIPCHRVTPRRGGPGSYIAGERKKQWLLKLEDRHREGFG